MESVSRIHVEAIAHQHLQKLTVRGHQAQFLCPFHEDRNPSGSINLDTGLWQCFACGEKGDLFGLLQKITGCDFPTAKRTVFGPNGQPAEPRKRSTRAALPQGTIVAVYPYLDETGTVLFEKVRLDPKQFYIRRDDGKGGYTQNIKGVRRVLYCLPRVRAEKDLVVIVEGEKDVATVFAFGCVATCNPFGGKEWSREYSLALQDKARVLILADNDAEGLDHAAQIAADLKGLGPRVVRAVMPAGKDVTEWLDDHAGTDAAFREWVATLFPPEAPAETVPGPPPAKPIPEAGEEAWCELALRYRDAVAPSTEASDNFHLAAFLTVAGAALGRLVYYLNPKPLYPNFFTALVGKSGRARKGTSIDLAEDLIQRVHPELWWVRSVNSAEGLVQTLYNVQERQESRRTVSAVLRFSELRSLIDKASHEGTRNIIPEISNLFDCPPRVERNTVKGVGVERPTVSIIGGAAQRWIENLKIDDLEGGIGNRFLWIAGKPKKRNAFPPAPQLHFLTHDLGVIRKHWLDKVSGAPEKGTEIVLEPEARAIYKRWYDALDRYYEHDLFQVLADRMEVHCPKIFMLYAALDLRATIRVSDVKAAIAFCEFLIESIANIFTDYGWAEAARQDQEIIAYVQKHEPKGIPKRRVQMHFGKWGGETFNKRLQWLTGEDGPIRSEKRGRASVLMMNPEDEP